MLAQLLSLRNPKNRLIILQTKALDILTKLRRGRYEEIYKSISNSSVF